VEHSDNTTKLQPTSHNGDTQSVTDIDRIRRLIAEWPLFIVIVALISLAVGIFPAKFGFDDLFYSPPTSVSALADRAADRATSWRLFAFLGWSISTGALGSIAYLAVNFLLIQKDAPFDIGVKSLVHIRIVLGVLFAVILSIPFAWEQFVFFAVKAVKITGNGDTPNNELFGLGIYLLMPFLFGFSTAVVLTILGRFVAAIDALFGGISAGTTSEAAKVATEAAEAAKVAAAKAVEAVKGAGALQRAQAAKAGEVGTAVVDAHSGPTR
jgi:hypothetical protein